MANIKKILIIGGGFAGVWSALSAMRHCILLNKEKELEITLINKDNYHGLRPRFYEEDLSKTRIPLEKILTPYGIKLVIGEVTLIDATHQKVDVKTSSSELEIHTYDKLILAAGSHLYAPNVPGLDTFGFNVDTYADAKHLSNHLHTLHKKSAKGQYTAVVVGGGFTGLEVATDLIDRLRKIAPDKNDARVIIVDHTEIGSTLGAEPMQVVKQALKDLNIETKTNVHVSRIEADQVILDSGEVIDTQTVIWSAGMRASALTKLFSEDLDKWGRILVDKYLHITNVNNCFAAGDVAKAMTDEAHPSLLCCQHAMPQGRWAGHNAVADLFNQPLIPYEQKKFVSIIDLGSWGAVYAEGWEQHLVSQQQEAKELKLYVNHNRILPLTSGNIDELLYEAAPVFRAMPMTE
ncbi:MAG: FAD-dependent oxidoreductase [Taibaiella sp.]|jgi:NADH dehydrogenase